MPGETQYWNRGGHGQWPGGAEYKERRDKDNRGDRL